jgi:hypothetical protein
MRLSENTATIKNCKTCYQDKPIEQFAIFKKQGEMWLRCHCQDCWTEKSRERDKKRYPKRQEENKIRSKEWYEENKTDILDTEKERRKQIKNYILPPYEELGAIACKTCHIIKNMSDYDIRDIKLGKPIFYPHCSRCFANILHEQEKIKYAKIPIEKKIEKEQRTRMKYFGVEYIEDLPSKIIRNRQITKEEQIIKAREKRRNKRHHDPIFKLRESISRSVAGALKMNGASKGGKSLIDFIGYTMDELRHHIENQFENWMTWKNRGIYDPKTWNDDDKTTWTWQLDHIKPHSEFHYTSMEDQTFRDCWSLDNLRPLSAETNCLEGVRRIRHKKDRA